MKKELDAYQLKLIALLFMLLDHFDSYLSWPTHKYLHWPMLPGWISLLTRFVSPLFLYLMIDGFYHTRSRKHYMIRLYTAAVIMWSGNLAIRVLFHEKIDGLFSLLQGNNIFLTLALLFTFIRFMEQVKQRNKPLLNGFLAFMTAFLCVGFSEGGLYMLPVALIIWGFYGKKTPQCIGIGMYSIALLAKEMFTYFTGPRGTSWYVDLCFDNEWAMFLVIFFILLYNGERGKNTKFTKYLFYVIYPVHLWILMILRFWITGPTVY